MAEITDALNYPYIRVRDVDWLKSTLLLFPHVGRIRPFDAPDDDPEIAIFTETRGARGQPLLRSINPHDISHDLQDDLYEHLKATLDREGARLRRRFGKEAIRREHSGGGSAQDMWARRMRGPSQLHYEKIAPLLLHVLQQNGLAWSPEDPDYPNYLEMHRVIGDAIMSTLAFAAAQSQGMRVVTEFPDLFAQTIARPIEEIFAGITAAAQRPHPIFLKRKGERLAETVIYRHCDLSLLDAQSLAMLSKEHEALSAFRDSVEEFARTIPTEMTDEATIASHLEDRAQHVIDRWQETKRNSLPSFRRIFGDEAGAAVKDGLKDAFKDSVKAAAPGMLLGDVNGHEALICAGGGLAIGVVFRFLGRTPEEKKEASALRYLNILRKHGVAISVSAA